MLKKRISNEAILAIIIVLFTLVISLINPVFFTTANLFDMIRSSIVTGIFAIGCMMVIISGGIDISFTAIAAFAMYSTTMIFNAIGYEGNILLPMIVSAAIGLGLGSVNAFLISKFNIPTLIATIGTANLFNGILLTFIGSRAIMILPPGFVEFAKMDIVSTKSDMGVSSVPVALVVLLVVGVAAFLILRFTPLGRGVYAIGGDAVSAKRIGFNVVAIQFFIYCFVGAVAGMGGLVYTSLMRTSNPFDIIGTELSVIAAVVLGGTKITGGYGSITGTLLGVLLITIINSSLILIGVSTYWQRAVIGMLILLGTGITAYQEKASARQMLRS